ncbi:PREDICTED: tissue factor pathway inhibitor-like [Tinamus guttatus]|uniref:tissue factor pathway inhibitor-like n=1 Tax=Tinamus guttatus TaxID=94827 RepID=UPI00052EB396|nr:PREDICTED: tissue factor pathway inhibitor-like [Tinamus guttatus]
MTTSTVWGESFKEPTSFITAASSDKKIMDPSQHERHKARSQLPASCLQPMDEGSCQRYMLLWYYHPEADACRPFVFGGCRGNSNRFETKWKCEQQCKMAAGFRSRSCQKHREDISEIGQTREHKEVTDVGSVRDDCDYEKKTNRYDKREVSDFSGKRKFFRGS